MKPQKGYYSLIQFCPDASRLESVNLGVILFCPAINFLNAKTNSSTRRAEKLVGRGKLAREALKQAQSSIENRLKVDRSSFQDIDSLRRFVATRGNALQLTSPRPVKVVDPDQQLLQLFDELVGGKPLESKRDKALFPKLSGLFTKLSAEGRAELDVEIKLPVMDHDFKVPFAFRNGVMNLVKPQAFNTCPSQKALDLAIRGDLIHRHGIGKGADAAKLVVVSHFEQGSELELMSHVDSLFDEYSVTHVRENEIEMFMKRIESEAHA